MLVENFGEGGRELIPTTAPGHPRPPVLTVDGNPSYPKVIVELKPEWKLGRGTPVEPDPI